MQTGQAFSGFVSFMTWFCERVGGLLELYQVTGETKWLQWCQKLQATLDELFWDETSGKEH